jgi:mannose-6-phosphate isomerase
MSSELYPLRFKPIYKDYLWGGDRIVKTFGRDEPPGIYAESWEVTDRPEGMSVVVNGSLAGCSLHELIEKFGAGLLGTEGQGPVFPLLIKLIDSRQCLSVQVHPSDETAARYGGEAKTEMWYALAADPGSQIYAGLKPGVDQASFQQAIADHSFKDILGTVPMEAGTAVYIPGGRVHAIDAGCLILEVQQNSNTTYRIYDWGRVGADGKPRPLHIEQALQVINWDDADSPSVEPVQMEAAGTHQRWEVLTSPYFRMERLMVDGAWDWTGNAATFEVLFGVAGQTRLSWDGGETILQAGDTILVPASLAAWQLASEGTPSELLRITLP